MLSPTLCDRAYCRISANASSIETPFVCEMTPFACSITMRLLSAA